MLSVGLCGNDHLGCLDRRRYSANVAERPVDIEETPFARVVGLKLKQRKCDEDLCVNT